MFFLRTEARPPAVFWATTAVAVLAALPATAQTTTFNPQLSLTATYTDNVNYVDETGATASDLSMRLGVVLPFERTMKNGAMSFSYDTGYTKYRDNPDFDHDGHRLSYTYSTKPDRRSNLHFRAGYVLTQDQGNPRSLGQDSVDFFLSERTQRQSLDADVQYDRQGGPLWGWGLAVGGTLSRFEGIRNQEPLVDVEDRNAYRASFDLHRAVSRRFSVGGGYRYLLTDLADSGNQATHAVVVTATRRFSEHSSVEFEVGGYKRTFGGSANSDEFHNKGFYASANYSYDRPLGPVALSLYTGVRPTSGGSLRGTSTDTTAAVNLSNARARIVDWFVSARYTRREPAQRSEPTTDTASLGAGLETGIGALLGFRLAANYADQSVSGSSEPLLDGSFYTVGASLVWYPLGRTRIANRGI